MKPPLRRLALALLALSLVAQAALAKERPEDCPIDPRPAEFPAAYHRLVRDLLGWIGAHSVYDTVPMIADPPTVTFCETGEPIHYAGRDMIVGSDLRAAYDRNANHVFLVWPWSPYKLADRATLLHELVHAAQFRDTEWPCLQASEPQAYRLQSLWLGEQGVAVNWDWFAIYLAARCPQDVPP